MDASLMANEVALDSNYSDSQLLKSEDDEESEGGGPPSFTSEAEDGLELFNFHQYKTTYNKLHQNGYLVL